MKMDAKFEKLEGKIIMAETSEINADAVGAIVQDLAALCREPAADVGRLREFQRRTIALIDNRRRLLLGEKALLMGHAQWQ
jgi:hypothetical protein